MASKFNLGNCYIDIDVDTKDALIKLDEMIVKAEEVESISKGLNDLGLIISPFGIFEPKDKQEHDSIVKEAVEAIRGKELKMKHVFPNGVSVEGNVDLINDMARKLGYRPVDTSNMYNSSTHGWVSISSMDKSHLRNAMLKLYREWASNLSAKNDRELVFALREGPNDSTFKALLAEFVRRV